MELSDALASLSSATIGGNLIVNGDILQSEKTHLFWWVGNATETIEFAAINTWYFLTNSTNDLFTVEESENITSSGDKFTIIQSGDYDLTAKVSGIGTANKVYSVRFYNETTNTPIPTAGNNVGQGATDVFSIITSAYGEGWNVGDIIRLEIMSDDTDDFTLKNATVKATLLHT